MCHLEKLVTLTYNTSDLSTTVSDSMHSLKDTLSTATRSVAKQNYLSKKGAERKSIELEFTRLSGDEQSFRTQGRKVFDILRDNQYLQNKFTDFDYIAAGGFGIVFKAKKKINQSKPYKNYEERELHNDIAFKFMLNDQNAKREIVIMKKLFSMSTRLLMARNIQVFRRYEIMSKQNSKGMEQCRIVNSENNFIVNSPPQLAQSLSEGSKDRVPFVMIEMSKAAFSVDAAIVYRKRHKKPYFIYEINKIMHDMLQCLFMMHIQGIVHLDLKPQNLLYVDELHRYTLSDFGCSLELNSIDFENFQLSTDEIVGFTPQYTDPSLMDREYFNPFKADMWSMGVVLLELLSVGQDFDLVEILKTCKTDEDIENKIFKQYIYNCNGQMVYCPRMKNFIEIDNQLRMYLQMDETKRWNIIEVLIETQNQALIQPFNLPFNYTILNKKLFSFLVQNDNQPSTPQNQTQLKTCENGVSQIDRNLSYSQTDCPYLNRQQQFQKQNIYLTDGDLIQGWKYRGFVHSNHNLQQSGMYSSESNLIKDGKGTILNQENRVVFQGVFDRDYPSGQGTYILSNFCDRKASFTGIPSIDEIMHHLKCDQSINDIEKITYEGEFLNGLISGGTIMYVNEKKGISYQIKRAFRSQQTFDCPIGKIVSCLDLDSKYMSVNIKSFRLTQFDKRFYVSSKTYIFQIFKSYLYKESNTIDKVMQNIKAKIIDTDTKFIQRLTTGSGHNFYFEQSILVYAYFLSNFQFHDRFIKSTIIQDISSSYALYDMFLLFEHQVSDQIMSSMKSIKKMKSKGRLAHDKICNYDFYKQFKGILQNLESFCENRDTEFMNFKEFGMNKKIKYFDLNCTSYVSEEECQYIAKREVANDQQAYEFFEFKDMKRIGMNFVTNNYFEKYISKSLNTLDYLNISFYNAEVKADFTGLKQLKALRKLKIYRAASSQIQQIFENLNSKNLKTLHLGRQCEYDQKAVDALSKSDFSNLRNYKLINYDRNQGKWIEDQLKTNQTLTNLTKICLKTCINQLFQKLFTKNVTKAILSLVSQKLKNLEILKLSYCQMDDDLASSLKNLTKVTTLYLNSNIITDDGTKYLYENMPNVRKLKLNNSQNLSFRGLYLLSSHMKKLEVIEFKNILPHFNYYQFSTERTNKNILSEKEKSGGITFIDSLYELKNLQSLRFAQQYEDCFFGENHYMRCRTQTPEFIKSLAVLKLTEIDLSDIKEDYLKHFLSAKGVSNAIKLVLNPKVNQISDEIALALISGNFNQLQHLSLSSCYNLSSATIKVLLQNKSIHKTLKELYLNNTEFDDTCAEYLFNFFKLFPLLNIISIKNCIEISDEVLKKLAKQMQQNKITLIY